MHGCAFKQAGSKLNQWTVISSSWISFRWPSWWVVPCHELLLVSFSLLSSSHLLWLFSASVRCGAVAYLRYLLGFSASLRWGVVAYRRYLLGLSELAASFGAAILRLLTKIVLPLVTIPNWSRPGSSSVSTSPPWMNEWSAVRDNTALC